MEKTRVIVECRAQRLTSVAAGNIDPQQLRIDASFPAVLINPASTDLQLSLDARQDHLVLVRGSIQPTRLDDLRTLPNVVDVNFDMGRLPVRADQSSVQSKGGASRPSVGAVTPV